MCLRPASPLPVPDDTAHVARLAFPRGNLLLSLRDRLGPVFDDRRFARLFPAKGQPAEAPWRLALVTLLQFAEGLPDCQAADAVRSRIDWKYLLGLPLADAGFDSTVLSEFRSRLVAEAAEALLLMLFWRLRPLIVCSRPGDGSARTPPMSWLRPGR